MVSRFAFSLILCVIGFLHVFSGYIFLLTKFPEHRYILFLNDRLLFTIEPELSINTIIYLNLNYHLSKITTSTAVQAVRARVPGFRGGSRVPGFQVGFPLVPVIVLPGTSVQLYYTMFTSSYRIQRQHLWQYSLNLKVRGMF